ncbi:MAG TPA: hypothetical protein VK188_05185 [Holophaga sp.]|nr:hypothetical protein [Holophaga sp.]
MTILGPRLKRPPLGALGLGLLGTCLQALSPAQPKSPAYERGSLLSLGPVEEKPTKDFLDAFLQEVSRRKQDIKAFGLLNTFKETFQSQLSKSAARSRVFTYASEDAHGPDGPRHPRTYSGRVFFPPHPENKALPFPTPLSVPLVVYVHATETRRNFVPSNNYAGEETMFGALAAAMGGFVVAMPDGDGMGKDTEEMHHYCYGETAAKCTVDCIQAMLDEYEADDPENRGKKKLVGVFDNVNYVWDGRVFIVGYSEGGYIAMAAVKELSRKDADGNYVYPDIPLSGAACMAGPFDFHASTLKLLDARNTAPYDRPYIPAYFMKAFEQIAPSDVKFADAINASFLPLGRNDKTLPPRDAKALTGWLGKNSVDRWVGGEFGGDDATAWMNKVLTGDPKKSVSARKILDERWVQANLDNPDSRLNQLLRANNLVGEGSGGDWSPRDKAPILLMHDRLDTTVAYENSEAAYRGWFDPGSYVPMDIQDMTLRDNLQGSGHVLGAVLAIPSAFMWIANGMSKALPDTFKSIAKSRITSLAKPILGGGGADALSQAMTNDRTPDQPLLEVSHIKMPTLRAGEMVTVSFDDWFKVIGKIKLYGVADKPQFANQPEISPGAKRYFKLLKGGELRKVGDKLEIDAATMNATADPGSLYMAVYPSSSLVALTPRFTGGSKGKPFDCAFNIKQAFKNKVVNRKTPATIRTVKGGTDWLNESAFENAYPGTRRASTFIDLSRWR